MLLDTEVKSWVTEIKSVAQTWVSSPDLVSWAVDAFQGR